MIRRRDPGHFGTPLLYVQHIKWLITSSDSPTVPVVLGIVLFFAVLSNFIIRGNHLITGESRLLILFLLLIQFASCKMPSAINCTALHAFFLQERQKHTYPRNGTVHFDKQFIYALQSPRPVLNELSCAYFML